MLGLGTWKAPPGEVGKAVAEALRLGYRHIDCAPIYGNEAEIGEALGHCLRRGLVRREELWITSKLWNDAHAPEDVAPALERTLGDLRLERLDLYLIHWPVALRRGAPLPPAAADILPPEAIPLADTWRAMEETHAAGRCRHIGVSNFSVPRLRRLLEGATTAPAVNQVELHPYHQDPGLLAFCRRHGIAVTAYAALGSADRPARLRSSDEPCLLEDPLIGTIAARHNATPAQVLLRWALQRGTAVLAKSVNPDHLRQNLAAAQLGHSEASLSEADMNAIAGLERGFRYVSGSFWAPPGSPYTLRSLWQE
jgi:alcohol dehydrogenase (NADP+)